MTNIKVFIGFEFQKYNDKYKFRSVHINLMSVALQFVA